MASKTYTPLFAFLISLMVFAPDGFARQWKPSSLQAAQEYLNLNHSLKNGDQILLMWIAPQYIEQSKSTEPARKLLKQYTLLGISHYNVDNTGVFNITKIDDISIELSNSKVLKPVDEDKLPPLIPTFTTFLSKALAGGMGRIGKSIKYYTFDAGGIDGCGGEMFFVKYLDERYEFKAPIPGC